MKKIFLVVFCIHLSCMIKAQTPPMCFETIAKDTTVNVAMAGRCVRAYDFNLDGKLDLAVGGWMYIAIYMGYGNGVFSAPTNYAISGTPTDIFISDINSDGIVDLVAPLANVDNVNISYGLGNGVFYAGQNHHSGFTTQPNSIVAADFNGDGKPDLASANTQSQQISVWINTVAGMGFHTSYWVGKKQRSITCADFNGDGKADLATANHLTNDISILIGNGTGSFSTSISYSTGTTPYCITKGDFNGDGKVDLAVVNNGSNNVSILTGSGTGTFSVTANYTVGSSPNHISVGDINADGYLDLVTANSNSDNVSVLMGSATGSFAPVINNGTGNQPIYLTQGDFNTDGKIDLAVINATRHNVSLLFGNALGNFSTKVINNAGGHQNSATANDFNGDGHSDVAVANFATDDVSIFTGTGTGIFVSAGNYTVGSQPTSITSGDFNGDGIIDLANTNNNSDNISILIGNTLPGTFNPAVNYSVAASPYSIVTGDFNSDGNLDLVTANYGSNDVSIMIGTGTGTFLAPVNYSVGMAPVDILTGDFNSDGHKDLAVVNFGSNNFSILIGSGAGTFASAVNYMTFPKPLAIAKGDFNADGIIDLATSYADQAIRYYTGTGLGTFTVTGSIGSSAIYSVPLLSGDFNGDNISDLITVGRMSNNINIFPGNGSGTSSTWFTYADSLAPVSIVATDVNSDGKTDIVATNNYSHSLITLLNRNPPIISVAGTNSICVGSTAVLIASGASTYTWNNSFITDSLTISPSSTSTLTVVGTDTIGCSNSKTITLFVNPSPTISVNSGSICIGDSFTFTPTGANSYTISGGSYIVSPTTSSNYTVSGTDANNCIGTATPQIIVNQNPIISINNGTICEGQSFTIAPNGANTYTYSGGSNIVTPISTSNYTVTGEDANYCVGSATTQVTVYPNPTVTVISSNSICIGTSALVTASGANTFSWNTGETTSSVSVTPATTSVYTVTGTDLNNCSNTQTVSVVVDSTCADIWPGDANSDGIADNLDVLELGLHYTQTGAPRASTSNTWQSYFANNWTGTISNGKNLNHSDCNGDGTINDNDTLAIYNNYGLTHAFKPAQTTTINPQLSIVPDQASVVKGNWGTASIYLGDAATNLNTINGVAFTLDFDNTLIETNSVYIEYQNSFLDAGQNLHFRKLDFTNGKIHTATTHTNNINVSGNGLIAKLHYQIKSNLTTDEVLNIGLSQANQSNASGAITPLTSGTGTLMAIGASVGMQELNGNGISVSPNPTNGSLTINSKTELQKIEVVAITGQVLLSETPTNVSHTLHLDNFANGIYFVNLYQNDRIVKREKVVLNK